MTEDAVSRFVMENILYRFAGLPKGIKDCEADKVLSLRIGEIAIKEKVATIGK